MYTDYIFPEFLAVRDMARCTSCRLCTTECANGVHIYDEKKKMLTTDDSKCVACQRCAAVCPVHALKIVKNDATYRPNANWSASSINEVIKQSSTGGVLLSSMGARPSFPSTGTRS